MYPALEIDLRLDRVALLDGQMVLRLGARFGPSMAGSNKGTNLRTAQAEKGSNLSRLEPQRDFRFARQMSEPVEHCRKALALCRCNADGLVPTMFTVRRPVLGLLAG